MSNVSSVQSPGLCLDSGEFIPAAEINRHNTDIVPMHQEAILPTQRPCAYCATLFEPKKRWAAFCKPECRTSFDVDIGATGTVKGVRKLSRNRVSVIVWLEGPAAERALNLNQGDRVRAVRQP